jgi:hypothetical protein
MDERTGLVKKPPQLAASASSSNVSNEAATRSIGKEYNSEPARRA